MSNGYLVAAEADLAAARELGEGFQLDVLELGALNGEAAVSLLAGAANVGVILSNAAAHDARFFALAEALASRLNGAQLIVAQPDARARFGFFPDAWPVMPLDEARRRANELKRRREPAPPPPAEPEEPVHAAPLPPVAHEEPLVPAQETQAEAQPHAEPAPDHAKPEVTEHEPPSPTESANADAEAPINEEMSAPEPETEAATHIDDVDAPAPSPPLSVEPPPEGEPPTELHEEPPAPPGKIEPPVAAAPAPEADEMASTESDALAGSSEQPSVGAQDAAPAPTPEPAPPAASPAPAPQAADGFGAQSVGAARSRGGLSTVATSLTADASAFAPKKLRRATPELVRVVIYQPHQLKEVLKEAKKIDPRAEAAPSGMRVGDVTIGESVGVSLEVRGANCDGAIQRRVWNGEPIDFAFTVEAEDDAKQAVILARVFVGDAQVGVVAFTRPITGAAKKAASAERLKLKRHKRVFLSYSSQDRETVSAIATAYAAAGVPYFWDRSSLKSGEEWSPRLRKEIDKADLFHLCWSKSASKSEWVEKEAAHALTRRKRSNGKHPDITVQMLDGPPWAPHPIELDSINFDDFVRAAVVGYARGDGSSEA